MPEDEHVPLSMAVYGCAHLRLLAQQWLCTHTQDSCFSAKTLISTLQWLCMAVRTPDTPSSTMAVHTYTGSGLFLPKHSFSLSNGCVWLCAPDTPSSTMAVHTYTGFVLFLPKHSFSLSNGCVWLCAPDTPSSTMAVHTYTGFVLFLPNHSFSLSNGCVWLCTCILWPRVR